MRERTHQQRIDEGKGKNSAKAPEAPPNPNRDPTTGQKHSPHDIGRPLTDLPLV
jgi:hypothetical protein